MAWPEGVWGPGPGASLSEGSPSTDRGQGRGGASPHPLLQPRITRMPPQPPPSLTGVQTPSLHLLLHVQEPSSHPPPPADPGVVQAGNLRFSKDGETLWACYNLGSAVQSPGTGQRPTPSASPLLGPHLEGVGVISPLRVGGGLQGAGGSSQVSRVFPEGGDTWATSAERQRQTSGKDTVEITMTGDDSDKGRRDHTEAPERKRCKQTKRWNPQRHRETSSGT